MAIREEYGYANAKYALLEAPVRGVSGAFGRANHFLDTVQEGVYIESGMVYTAKYIHNVAHKMLKWLDEFSEILHERHLMMIYPPIPELVEDVRDMNTVFEIVIRVFDEVQEELNEFHSVAETIGLKPLAIKTEDLMEDVSEEYTHILEMMKMWENGVGYTSFDKWVGSLLEDDD